MVQPRERMERVLLLTKNLLGESAANYPSSGNRFILSTAKTGSAVKYSANETSSWMLNDKDGTARAFAKSSCIV